MVRDLATGKERSFPDVTEYSMTKDGKWLVYIVAGKKDDAHGVYAVSLDSQAGPAIVKAGKGKYSRLVWDEKQTRLAFIFEEATESPTTTGETGAASRTAAPAHRHVYLWERESQNAARPSKNGAAATQVSATFPSIAPAVEIVGPSTNGLKAGWQISDRTLLFSADGKKLSISAMPEPKRKPAAPAASPNEEKVDLDIWHWKDEMIQPMQKIRGDTEANRSYPAVYLLDSKQFRMLSEDARSVNVPSYGDWGISSDDRPYLHLTGYGPSLSDYTLVNIRTGDRKPIVQAYHSSMMMSPHDKQMVSFDGKDWCSYSVPEGKKINLTEKLAAKFFSEDFDSPSEPSSYGFVGWTPDDKHILVYDRFDLWKLAVDGSSAVNMTKIGREQGLQFRYVRMPDGRDNSEPGIDLSKPMLFKVTNLKTLDTGFYRLQPQGEPKLLVMGAREYGIPSKARDADVLLMDVKTFNDYPDYYATSMDFREIRRVTDINPHKAEFNWGKSELIHYQSLDGKALSGVLITPENFDPSKKYPMIVYIYERLSNSLHTFRMPSAGTSINPTYYASNGYLVLMPDIAYTIGSPGQSALKCVLPAIQAVADRAWLKEDAIGIQGHSWGGYQIAYLVTQTNRFKAAAAGAPVSNMVSAYGGIRWGTGLPREFQYERTQSRIGATLWQAPMKFIENSPVFMADRVQTPLMILHNDQDDAVPWYQGIEYYLALRRLGKEVYMLNYNGELHGLRKKATQRDYTLRMQQFFDHHLKGAPQPDWMAKGVKYSERDSEKEQWKGTFKPAKKE